MIEARGLVKRYRPHHRGGQPQLRRPPRHGHGVPRPERGGQVHHDADDAGPGPAGRRDRSESTASATSDLRWPLREVGALLEAKAFHPGRTARAHLTALAASNDIPRRRVDEVLEITGMETAADRRAGKFSLGMAQRLGIAAALLGDPAVLLLDEPVNGLDPEGIRWIRNLLKNLAAHGRTVLVSSHLISEIAHTADALIVIGQGALLAQTTVAELSARSSSLEEAFFGLTDGGTEYSASNIAYYGSLS